MGDSELPTFRLDLEIERTFQRNRRARQRLNRAYRMGNQNNQNNLANQNFWGQNPTYLAHDLNWPIRSYASPNLYDFNPSIIYPAFGETARFEIKPVMLQMIQNAGQFGGHPREDLHNHIYIFYSICTSFNMPGISQDELHFVLFSLTLRDKAKQ